MPTPIPGSDPRDDIYVEPGEIGDIIEKLDSVGALYRDIFEQELTKLGRELVIEVKERSPKASGRLARSTKFRLLRQQDDSSGDVEYDLQIIQDATSDPRARVSQRHFYWYTVHHGLKPAGRLNRTYPPSANLENWVRRVKGSEIGSEADVKRIAKTIAWNISKKGIKPNRYLIDSMKAKEDRIQEAANKIGESILINMGFLPEVSTGF